MGGRMMVAKEEERLMSARTINAKGWQWPADVLEYAARQKVQDYLNPLLEATRRIFPTARQIVVNLNLDPEIADEWCIVFDVRVPAPDVPRFIETKNAWNRKLFRICPAPLVCTFALCVDLVPP
jgi:hypothetical protein